MHRDHHRFVDLARALPLGALVILGCSGPTDEPLPAPPPPAEAPLLKGESSSADTEPRFLDQGDGTALDRTTGLLWETKVDGVKCGHCVEDKYSWSQTGTEPDGTAFTVFLQTLNARCDGDEKTPCSSDDECAGIGNGLCGHAGHRDWRLPLEYELVALLLEPFECALSPCIDPSFPGAVKPSAYWASTSTSPDTARGVFFSNGFVGSGTKTGGGFARAVRDPAADSD
jgi:hypothetical protein